MGSHSLTIRELKLTRRLMAASRVLEVYSYTLHFIFINLYNAHPIFMESHVLI